MLAELQNIAKRLADLGAVEVWLFGSHANGRATPESDIDLLVVGPKSLLEELRAQEAWGYDIFVNISGDDDFRSPWREASGSYTGWQWRRISKDEASYMAMKANKWLPDYASGFRAKARLIFTRHDADAASAGRK